VGAGIADQVSDSRLVALFGDGATIVLQALHRVWPPIIDFVGALASELGHPVQANAYVTPPQNQGFDDHYDVHDVFVLQVSGAKRWRIHAPVWESPLRDQPWTDRRAAVQRAAAEPPLIEAVLEPGDCLYLPRGFLHAATALGGVSTHLTLGVHTWTRLTLAEQLTAQALRSLADDADLRASLALGTDPTRPDTLAADVDRVRAALVDAVRTADLDTLAAALRRSDRDSRRPAPVGPLRQLEAVAALVPGTLVRLREHLAASLDQAAGRSVLRSRAGELALDEADVAPVKALLDEGSATVADLGDDLARRLLLGAVVVAD
jgi:lysine-specific demethylase/histidyl-hydroxylase NO66